MRNALCAERPNEKLWLAYAALATGILCIGFSAIFVKFAAVPGPVSGFYRMFIASMVLVPWWLRTRPSRLSRSDVKLIVVGGFFFGLDIGLFNTGVLLTSAATATLFANNTPLWVGLGSLLLFREHLSSRYWMGLIIALSGMSIIMGVDAWRELQLNLGNLLAISASFFYAAYLLATQRARAGLDTLTVLTLSVLSSSIVLLITSVLFNTPLIGYPAETWAALIALGLVSQVGGWMSINYALGHLRATHVSVSLLGQPIVTALVSIPLLGEYLRVEQVIGGILVLSGIYLVNRRDAAYQGTQ